MLTRKWILKQKCPNVLTLLRSNWIASKDSPFLVVRRIQGGCFSDHEAFQLLLAGLAVKAMMTHM